LRSPDVGFIMLVLHFKICSGIAASAIDLEIAAFNTVQNRTGGRRAAGAHAEDFLWPPFKASLRLGQLVGPPHARYST
jgi:hypothetical protein